MVRICFVLVSVVGTVEERRYFAG